MNTTVDYAIGPMKLLFCFCFVLLLFLLFLFFTVISKRNNMP